MSTMTNRVAEGKGEKRAAAAAGGAGHPRTEADHTRRCWALWPSGWRSRSALGGRPVVSRLLEDAYRRGQKERLRIRTERARAQATGDTAPAPGRRYVR